MNQERDGDYVVALSKTLWAAHVRAGDAMAKFKAELRVAMPGRIRMVTR